MLPTLENSSGATATFQGLPIRRAKGQLSASSRAITDSVARPVRKKLELSISALPSALRISAGVPM